MNQPMSNSERNQHLSRIAENQREESRRRGIEASMRRRFDEGVWGVATMKKLRRKQPSAHVAAAEGGAR